MVLLVGVSFFFIVVFCFSSILVRYTATATNKKTFECCKYMLSTSVDIYGVLSRCGCVFDC